jgi:hypothetical protein
MRFVLSLTLLLGWTVRHVVVVDAVVVVVDPVVGMSGDPVVGIVVFAEALPGASPLPLPPDTTGDSLWLLQLLGF